MFERFTSQARHVVVLAQDEARRLQHNYIGTEHVLLGLLGESGGLAFQVLERFGMSLDSGREEVHVIVGTGKGAVSGHIPFTPRAKKVLELALREALQLQHNYIGTEHILLGLVREGFGTGGGIGGQVLRQHSSDLMPIPIAVLDLAAARQALRSADVTGTSDEQPEEAGRRKMLIRLTDKQLTIEATDPVIVDLGRAALRALGDQADPPGTIRGDLPASASLSNVWQALHDSLGDIQRRAALPADSPGKPDRPGTEAA